MEKKSHKRSARQTSTEKNLKNIKSYNSLIFEIIYNEKNQKIDKSKINYIRLNGREAQEKNIYNFIKRLKDKMGIIVSDDNFKEIAFITELYFEGGGKRIEREEKEIEFKDLFDEVTKEKIKVDKLDYDFTGIIDDLYKSVKKFREERIEENSNESLVRVEKIQSNLLNEFFIKNLISSLSEMKKFIFFELLFELEDLYKEIYDKYTDEKLQEIEYKKELLVKKIIKNFKEDIGQFIFKIPEKLVVENIIRNIFLESYAREIKKVINQLNEEYNFSKEFQTKYKIPDKKSFSLKEIVGIIQESNPNLDFSKIYSNLRKTASDMALSQKYKIENINEIPRERVINYLIEREVREERMKGKALTVKQWEKLVAVYKTESIHNQSGQEKIEEMERELNFELFFATANAKYARERGKGKLNNFIRQMQIEVFEQMEIVIRDFKK